MEILTEGTYKGARARVIARRDEYSADMMPDDYYAVPQFWIATEGPCWRVLFEHNMDEMPENTENLMRGLREVYALAGQLKGWNGIVDRTVMVERWLRIIGFKAARAQEVWLDRSTGGLMVSVVTEDWLDERGLNIDCAEDIVEDTRDTVNWLKGDVSYLEAQVADHECNCEYCDVQWRTVDHVAGIYEAPHNLSESDAEAFFPLD